MVSASAVRRAVGAGSRGARLMLRLGVVRLFRGGLKTAEVQAQAAADEVFDRVKHIQPYGVATSPLPGSEVLLGFLGGATSLPVAIVVGGRLYRPVDLRTGEVCLYDNLGQRIHLTRDGIVIDGAGLPVTIKHAPSLTIDVPEVIMTGSLAVHGDVTDRSASEPHTMAGMRDVYDRHRHPGDSGGTTGTPTEAM